VPGWQVIGSFYVGHDRDPYNRPVSASYDNSWSLFTRYDFQKDSPLRGWAIGTGFVRVGGRWVTTSGVLNAVWTPAQTWGGVIEMKTGNSWNGFVSYKVDKHWSAKFDCMNILGEKWPLGLQTMLISDPSPPRTFTFETDYRF
jgi:outer membrane receptor for ferric coprogen and ferric-rhodotorulic acid